jgi:hypothetical protein
MPRVVWTKLLMAECTLPPENLAKDRQQAYHHEGFWAAIDNLREQDICLLKQL